MKFLSNRSLKVGLFLLSVVCLLWFLYLAGAFTILPTISDSIPTNSLVPRMPQLNWASKTNWLAFHSHDGRQLGPSNLAGKQYRLAGTFFSFQDAALGKSGGSRKAIIDDVEHKQQYLLAEHDQLGVFEVANIFHDRVTLRGNGQEIELTLSFASDDSKLLNLKPTNTSSVAAANSGLTNSSPFGQQVGKARWVLKREALMDYYRELLDDPERLTAIYASLKPNYNAEHKIESYRLEVEGEGNFFKAMGLEPGDKIFKVNSMPMTSKSRAEYFIREFANNRINAFVLDVERNNQQSKLIYLVR